jgi:hypothetical protein
MPEAGGAPAWQRATLDGALTRLEADGLLRHRRTVSVQGAGHMVSITHAQSVALGVQAHLDAC